MALRTYTALRLGVVVVIIALAIAVGRMIAKDPNHCVQASLSAYYYTPVRPVFVGALLIIGFGMISMWGKSFLEDAALNLAGLLLTVVAFVPTLDATGCTLADGQPQTPADEEVKIVKLIEANAPEVQSNFFTFLVTVCGVLLGILVIGGWLYLRARRLNRTEGKLLPPLSVVVGYVVTWVMAAGVVGTYYYLYQKSWIVDAENPGHNKWDASHNSFFNYHVHSYSANIGVGLVVFAALLAAVDKTLNRAARHRKFWLWTYAVLAGVMIITAIVIKWIYKGDSGTWYGDHATFLLEAILVGLIGVFWVLQTIDRRNQGAPKYTTLVPAAQPAREGSEK